MADDANAEGEYDAEEGDDDTEESLDGGDADVDDESPAAPAQPQQPPRSIMKTIFGRLLGRRTSEVGSLTTVIAMTQQISHAQSKVPAFGSRQPPALAGQMGFLGGLSLSTLLCIFRESYRCLTLDRDRSWGLKDGCSVFRHPAQASQATWAHLHCHLAWAQLPPRLPALL